MAGTSPYSQWEVSYSQWELCDKAHMGKPFGTGDDQRRRAMEAERALAAELRARTVTTEDAMSGRMNWKGVATVVEKRKYVARAKERTPLTKPQPRGQTDRLAEISRRQMERHRKGTP